MNRRHKITLICTLAAIAVLGLTWTRAQIPPGSDYGGEYMDGGGTYGGMLHGGGMSGGSRMPYTPMGYGMGGPGLEPPAARELNARLAPVLQRWRDASDDQQKEAIKGQLSSILEDYFQKDLQRRSSEIDTIEQRVQRLREQLEQRQQAKDEILQLQLKVLENEAAGLGFFGRRPAAPGFDGGMMSGGILGESPGYPVPPAFRKRTLVNFINTPLDVILDFLRDVTDANIYVDQHALQKAEIAPGAPVTWF